jgi:hypothetical protein
MVAFYTAEAAADEPNGVRAWTRLRVAIASHRVIRRARGGGKGSDKKQPCNDPFSSEVHM